MRRKTNTIKRIIGLLFTLIVLSSALLLWGKDLYSIKTLEDGEHDAPYVKHMASDISTEPDRMSSDNTLIKLDIKDLSSKNAILVRLADQAVLYEKNSDDIIYPASLTKIMTAIIALENLTDLDQPIRLSEDMFDNLYEENASLAGFLPGETVSAIDLLYGVLLPSGAECCIGLAEDICGSEETFVELMNEKAEDLGMENTHFVNTTGLHSRDHYTTVRDLSVLLEYCLQNDTFREIFTSQRHYTEPTDLHPGGITLCSTLFQNMDSAGISDSYILGGKTGYTSKAGLCLASLARIDETEYILITAAANGNHSTKQYNIEDALYVYSKLQ